MPTLTISLGSLDLLEECLEPAERGGVTADPEELHTLEGAKSALLLAVPDVLEDGRERRNTCETLVRTRHITPSERRLTNTSANENSDLAVENILSRRTVRAVDAHAGEGTASGINLNEVTTGTVDTVILLGSLHRGLGHRGDNLGASTDTLSQCIGPVTDLTDVDRDVGVLRRRGDGKLSKGGQKSHIISTRSHTYRVPLETRDVGHLNEQPLAGDVLEAGLDNTQLHSACRQTCQHQCDRYL